MDKNAGSVFEQRNALARLRAPLRDEVRTKNAGSVFEQRNALAPLRAPLRDEGRTKNAGSVFEQRNALACLRAPLRDEGRNRAGGASHGWQFLRLSDPSVFPVQAQSYSNQSRLCQQSQ